MIVISNACVGCSTCKLICPKNAIEVIGLVEIDDERCIECGKCVMYCPLEAIKII